MNTTHSTYTTHATPFVSSGVRHARVRRRRRKPHAGITRTTHTIHKTNPSNSSFTRGRRRTTLGAFVSSRRHTPSPRRVAHPPRRRVRPRRDAHTRDVTRTVDRRRGHPLATAMFQSLSRSVSRRSTAVSHAATRACASSSSGAVSGASTTGSFTTRSFASRAVRHGRDWNDDVPASSTTRALPPPPPTRGFASSSSTDDDDAARDARDDDVVVDLDAPTMTPKSEKVAAIADRVCELTLLEVNELCDVLAERLGLGDVSGMMFGGGMMPMGGGGVAGAPTGAGAAAEAPAEEKTSFALKLESFDAAQKIKVIKEVRAITDLGLKEAKELVEGVPAVLKKDLKKEDAEELIAKLSAVGAKCALE